MNYHGKRDSGSTTQLVDGVHHVTFLTENMDRLLAFYVRVFDAEVRCSLLLEGLNVRAEDEPARVEDVGDSLLQLVQQWRVLRLDVNERDLRHAAPV